jgi:site-specific DNA recombinase
MRAVVYPRVSSEMQLEGYSLDAQLTTCRRLAELRGWEVVGVYTDEESAKTAIDRPAFQRMMQAARAGRFDVIIVHKLDRFARSVEDMLSYLRELEEINVALVSATEQFDFSTPMGRLLLTMLAAFAQWYLDNLSHETAKGKLARAEAGMWNGEIPFGYTVQYRKDGGDGQARPDEQEAQGVQLAFEKYATGQYSDNDIADILNEAGYRPRGRGERALELFSKDSVRDLLQNRFYLGEVQYKGQRHRGVHQAIISQELFDLCEKVRASRRHRRGIQARSDSKPYPLSGLARCARCGGVMRGSYSSVSRQRYYRDPAKERGQTCDQRMVRAERAEEALGDFLGQLSLPDDWKAQVLDIIEGKVGSAQQIEREQSRLQAQLERLKKLFVLGDITDVEYKAERDRLRAKLAALSPLNLPDLEEAGRILQNFGLIWDAATDKERQRILQILLNAVYLDSGERGPVVAVEPKADFGPLFEVVKIIRSETDPTCKIAILSPGASMPV